MLLQARHAAASEEQPNDLTWPEAKAAATNPASKSGLAAAANSCETQRIQLEQGKVTRGQALNAVRLSLLDDAPGTCR